jgi:hypothetical protein
MILAGRNEWECPQCTKGLPCPSRHKCLKHCGCGEYKAADAANSADVCKGYKLDFKLSNGEMAGLKRVQARIGGSALIPKPSISALLHKAIANYLRAAEANEQETL